MLTFRAICPIFARLETIARIVNKQILNSIDRGCTITARNLGRLYANLSDVTAIVACRGPVRRPEHTAVRRDGTELPGLRRLGPCVLLRQRHRRAGDADLRLHEPQLPLPLIEDVFRRVLRS